MTLATRPRTETSVAARIVREQHVARIHVDPAAWRALGSPGPGDYLTAEIAGELVCATFAGEGVLRLLIDTTYHTATACRVRRRADTRS